MVCGFGLVAVRWEQLKPHDVSPRQGLVELLGRPSQLGLDHVQLSPLPQKRNRSYL